VARSAPHFGRLRRRCHEWMNETESCCSPWCWVCHDAAQGGSEPSPRLLTGLSGNVGKHSLEYFTSDFVRVFVWRVLRLGFFVLSGRFSVGRFHFLSNHRNTTKHIVARPNRQFNTAPRLEPFRTAVRVPFKLRSPCSVLVAPECDEVHARVTQRAENAGSFADLVQNPCRVVLHHANLFCYVLSQTSRSSPSGGSIARPLVEKRR